MDDVAGGDGVSGVDFLDEEKVIDWLETQCAEVRSAIASRAALRVCANISRAEPDKLPPLALAVFRATLTSTVRGLGRTADVEWLRYASASAAAAVNILSARPALPALYAADSAAHSGLSAKSARSAARSVALSAHSSRTAAHSARSNASQDTRNARLSNFAEPLWQEIHAPPEIAKNHQDFTAFLSSDRATWGFWHDWYLAMWEGRFTDWDLAIEVAKIPNDVWGEGPEAVAAEIAKIKARRALESEIASLKAQLRRAHAVEAPAHRLHNNPPEAIENDQQIRNEITLIWDLLEEVETEIAEPAPSPAVLRGIADRLWEIPLRIAKYCGSIADVALKESAKVIGKTGTKAGIAWYLTDIAPQNEGVKAVVKAIWEFVKTLPPA